MSIITTFLATAVAIEHFYIFFLETLATQSDSTSRVFNMTKQELSRASVDTLFKNQGVYNAVIGLFLLYGIYVSSNGIEVTQLFLTFVIIVATYGSISSNKKILLTQGGPAILAILSLLIFK